MQRFGLVLVWLLAGGCATEMMWSSLHERPFRERLIGEEDREVTRILAHAAAQPGLALDLRRDGTPPRGLRRALTEGRSHLVLRHPFAFSFVAHALLANESPFRMHLMAVDFTVLHGRDGRGTPEPAALHIEGEVDPAFLRQRIESIDRPPTPTVRLTDSTHDRDLRVMLGGGMDRLLALGDLSINHETRTWIGVEGPNEHWQAALDEARSKRSLLPLHPYRVLVRRWRTEAGGGTAWFRVHLADIVVAAQITPAEKGAWSWDGLWKASLQAPAETARPTPWQDISATTLHYSEFQLDRKYHRSAVVSRAVLTPFTLLLDMGGEVGAAAITAWLDEEEPPHRHGR